MRAMRALVEVAGVRRHIDTGLLQDDPPQCGDWVLVHVGFAMSKISEEQALDQMRMLRMLGEDELRLQEVDRLRFGLRPRRLRSVT